MITVAVTMVLVVMAAVVFLSIYFIFVTIGFVGNLLFTTIAIIIFVFIISDVVLVFKTGGESELV